MTLNHILLIFSIFFVSFFNLSVNCSGEPDPRPRASIDLFSYVVGGWANYMRSSNPKTAGCNEFNKSVAELMGLDDLVRVDQMRKQEDEGIPLPTPDILRRSHLSSISTEISAENPNIEFFAEAYRAEHPEKEKRAVRRPSDASVKS